MAGAPLPYGTNSRPSPSSRKPSGASSPSCCLVSPAAARREVYLRLAAGGHRQRRPGPDPGPETPHAPARRPWPGLSRRRGGEPHSGAPAPGLLQAWRAAPTSSPAPASRTPLPWLGLGSSSDEEHDASYSSTRACAPPADLSPSGGARQRSVPIVLRLRHRPRGAGTPPRPAATSVELAVPRCAATLPKVRPVDVRREKLQHGSLRTPAAGRRGAPAEGRAEPHLPQPARLRPGARARPGWSAAARTAPPTWLHLADRRLRCHHCSCRRPVSRLALPRDWGDQDIQPFGCGHSAPEETSSPSSHRPQAAALGTPPAPAASGDALLDQIGRGEATSWSVPQMMLAPDFPQTHLRRRA